MKGDRVRLFLALELPAAAREALLAWRSEALPKPAGLRLTSRDHLHATLCFLGWRWTDEIEDIWVASQVSAGAAVPKLGLGESTWLPKRRPRVLAVTLEDHARALARVQSALSEALSAGGWYEPETRPFLAHVTLARVAKGQRPARRQLPPSPALSFSASRVTLYRSQLHPTGARYEPLRTLALGPAAHIDPSSTDE